jgi:hypothetical protein
MTRPISQAEGAEQQRAAGWMLVFGLPAGIALFIVVASINRSYLRPEYLDVPGQVFIASLSVGAIALILRGASLFARLSRNSVESPAWLVLRIGGSTVLLSLMLAVLCFIASGFVLLAAVRYGPSTAVEFRAEVAQVNQRNKCRSVLSFYNPPLRSISQTCADDLPLAGLRAGDTLVVREEVGKLGGTVTSIRRAPASPR